MHFTYKGEDAYAGADDPGLLESGAVIRVSADGAPEALQAQS